MESVLETAACPMKTALRIRLAVEEIFVNIASYAYPGKKGQTELSCAILKDPNRVRVVFSDGGVPFNPLEKEDADTSEEALVGREGGLGILLVKNTMDSVDYVRRDGRNVLTMEKRL